MSNTLSRGFYSGLIGGMATGVWIFVYVFFRGEWSGLPDFSSIDFWIEYFVNQFGYHVIFGGVFGIIYSRFYSGIPSEGVKKGLIFGLMVGVLTGLTSSTQTFLGWSLTGVEAYFDMGVGWLEGFLKWIPYGIVIGFVYERLNL